MSRPREIDRSALHRILWRRADRHGTIQFTQAQMAQEVGISPYHFSRILAEMAELGKLRQISIGRHNVRTYQITDPAKFPGPNVGEPLTLG